MAQQWNSGDVILLIGPLGAGKTQFAKGVGEALNLNEEITSPTYPIVNEYSSRPALIHMDLYRLHGLEDFENMGGLEYFNLNNICLIEWPQRALEANSLDQTDRNRHSGRRSETDHFRKGCLD
jgi:tRNA threonylcarbamoyladenosine biosynthesis protein TsaE